MIKAVIIEDEAKASDLLKDMLLEIDPGMDIKATLTNVDESIHYLSNGGELIDLIFCDVQLPDGLSFSIFNKINTDIPIVFITGYDQFMLNAFESNGIDYLLKPVSREDLGKALNKYKTLQKHFSSNKSQKMQQFINYLSTHKKTRMVVRRGIENITLLLNDVVLFYTENKVVHALDKDGRRYMVDKNLADLELELDEQHFFRANRQYILNIDYIKSFKPYERVKLWVELSLGTIDHSIIVSQETAPLFRRWVLNA
jgi:DNA-binding LytR/AlgR family response regulator